MRIMVKRLLNRQTDTDFYLKLNGLLSLDLDIILKVGEIRIQVHQRLDGMMVIGYRLTPQFILCGKKQERNA